MNELLLILGLIVLVAFASTCTVQISGTATGASCVSWFDCNLTCCTKSEISGCAGTNDHSCTYGDPGPCTQDTCCRWVVAEGCVKRDCVAPVGESHVPIDQCVHCGCVQAGTCIEKTCAEVAVIDNNPDVCAGCNICGGDWQIDNNRGDTPWSITVTGALDMQAGGRVDISGGHTLAAGTWALASGGTVGFSSGGVLALG